MRRRAYLATAGAATATLAGCFGASGSTEAYDIGMSSTAFLPEEFAVAPGTTVVWKNTSSHAHTVTAYEGQLPEAGAFFASGEFDSEQAARDSWKRNSGGAIYEGEVYEHTFEEPGEFPYLCIPHESNGMVGTIVVTEEATRTPLSGD